MFALDNGTTLASDTRPQRIGTGPSRLSLLNDVALMLGRRFSVYTAARQATAAAQLGLPVADCRALELLLEFEALPTGQLASLLGLSPGGTTALINRLEEAGFVRRSRHPLDRRMIVISPVPERCRPLESMMHDIAIEVGMHTQRFDDDQIAAAHAVLTQCAQAFRRDTTRWLENRPSERGGPASA